jgi:predicted AlkP superfamily pyrophosphatase or phosphodiesterase
MNEHSMHPTVVLNVVGLTPGMLGPHTPNLSRLAEQGVARPLQTITPAVTSSVQATFVTGALPREHGVVANGWYFRDLSEILFWRQSNRLVSGEKLWETARRRNPDFTCAKLFWWHNMNASADFAITPRPMYPADGRKIPDIYTTPGNLRDALAGDLGQFPLFRFWGPAADITSSQWIGRSALSVRRRFGPTLTLVYLPHLDYNLQRLGPSHPGIAVDLAAVDAICGELIEDAERDGARVVVLSEYGITNVERPVHLNRALREAGLVVCREEMGREILDPGASKAFAVADHQIAHIYIRNPDLIAEVKSLIGSLPGVDVVLDDAGKAVAGLDHQRAGDLVAIAKSDSWFTYYYWFDDERAPDFARTVDIHRKPGFDPVELFLDPAMRAPKLAIGWRLLKKALGFRTLMDVIPLDATLVKGSHGRPTDDPEEGPIFISSAPELLGEGPVAATSVRDLILDHVFRD